MSQRPAAELTSLRASQVVRPARSNETPRPAHVMQVVYDLSPGGSELLALAIAEGGKARGVRMSVCGLGGGRTLMPRQEASEVGAHSMRRRAGLQPMLVVRLYRLFRRERVTAVVTHHLGQLLYAGLAARLAGARLIHVEHEYYTLDPRRQRKLLRLSARLVERVVAVTEEVAEFLVDVIGVPRAKVLVIRNGVDIARFLPSTSSARHELAVPLDAPVIGTVGRLDPAKDHLTMLEAFCLIREVIPSAHLVIVGEGTCRSELEAFVDRHHLHDSVHLLGERWDIPALLPCMDVFALSSINEGLPLALLEAMACERPVITTDVGAAGKVVRAANAGLVVLPRDAGAFARAVITVLNDRGLARRLGASGRKVVEQRYNLATTLDSYLTLCDSGVA